MAGLFSIVQERLVCSYLSGTPKNPRVNLRIRPSRHSCDGTDAPRFILRLVAADRPGTGRGAVAYFGSDDLFAHRLTNPLVKRALRAHGAP